MSGKIFMYGWTGKTLHIDLSTGITQIETPETDLLDKWIGGKGLGGNCISVQKPPWTGMIRTW